MGPNSGYWRSKKDLQVIYYLISYLKCKCCRWRKIKKNYSRQRRCVCACARAHAQLCPTLCDPMDCNLPDSSVQEISQARILEWVATSFFRGASWPRDRTHVFCLGGGFFALEPPGKPLNIYTHTLTNICSSVPSCIYWRPLYLVSQGLF